MCWKMPFSIGHPVLCMFQLMIPPLLYEYVMDGSGHLSDCEAVLSTLKQLMPHWHELTNQLADG